MIKANKNTSLSFNKEDSSEIFPDENNKEKIIYRGYIKFFKRKEMEQKNAMSINMKVISIRINGQGVVIYKTGDEYKGEFKDDKLTGNDG